MQKIVCDNISSVECPCCDGKQVQYKVDLYIPNLFNAQCENKDCEAVFRFSIFQSDNTPEE